MNLRTLIQERLQRPFKIYNTEGVLIPQEKILKDYEAIKNHFDDNDVVAIKLPKDYHYFLCMLACMERGICYIPFKEDYPEARIQQVQELAKFTVLLTEEKLHEILNNTSTPKKLRSIEKMDPVYIMFTSGTTGMPKGVTIPQVALENFYSWIKSIQGIDAKHRILQVTEFTFDISLVDLGLFLVHDAEIYFSKFEKSIFQLALEIEEYGITILNTVPNNLNMLLNPAVVERANLQTLKELFIAGARFSHGLYKLCVQHLPSSNIRNLYGPTECTVYSHGKDLTLNEKLDTDNGNVSIGTCLPGVEARIVDKELLLGGVQLMKGYANCPELTKQALIEIEGKTYYKTGDLCFENERGEYFIVGRKDDTIKSRGFRINLLDIDSYIATMPYVQDCATIAIPNELIENEIVSFLILKENKTTQEILDDMRKILLEHQIPGKLIITDHFPTNTSGKVSRSELKDQYLKKSSHHEN